MGQTRLPASRHMGLYPCLKVERLRSSVPTDSCIGENLILERVRFVNTISRGRRPLLPGVEAYMRWVKAPEKMSNEAGGGRG